MEPSRCITLNVGGHYFMTAADTLKSLPDTRLGRLATDPTLTSQQDVELFFDRNPDLINSLLDLYRTGELHLPKHLCGHTVERELRFWEIPVELVRECCYKGIQEHKESAEITAEIDKFLTIPLESDDQIQKLSAWNRVWLIMERPGLGVASKIWSALFFIVVFLSVLFYMFETSMKFRDFHPWFLSWLAMVNISVSDAVSYMDVVEEYGLSKPEPWLRRVEIAIFVFFVAEFLVRLLACPVRSYMLKQAKNWFDIFLIVQAAVNFVLQPILEGKQQYTSSEVNALTFFYSLSVLRVMRIFYLAKHFDSMKILLLSTRASLKVLMLLAVCLMSMAAMFGSAVYLAELLTGYHTFTSIPYSLWYAIVTMTTVGYGDVVPASSVGRLLGVVCALCGVIVMALPVAVLANKFSSYHDNISARTQLHARLTFLNNHPNFSPAHGEEDTDVKRPYHQTLAGEKSTQSSDRGFADSNSGIKKSAWFSLRALQQRRKRRRSHPILVPEPYNPPDEPGSIKDVRCTITNNHRCTITNNHRCTVTNNQNHRINPVSTNIHGKLTESFSVEK